MRGTPVQLSLPTARTVISAGAFVSDMKRAMRSMVDSSGFSRDHFVDAMNEYARLADRERKEPLISRSVLDKLLADETRGQLPTLWVFEVMLRVSESLKGLEEWARIHDCGLMDAEARMKVEFAELELEKISKRDRRKALKQQLLEKRQ